MPPPSGWYKEFMAAVGVNVGSHKPQRSPPGKPATLGELHSEPFWLWLYCRNYHFCGHRSAVPLAPFIIRWGPEVDIKWLQARLRCTVCGEIGADTIHPSYHSQEVGWSPFPIDSAGPFSFGEDIAVCNLYSHTKSQQAIIELTRALRDTTGNLPMQPGIFPDYTAPIVRNAPDGKRELTMARWGMPSSQFALMQSAKKRAAKLEEKGKPVDFKQLLRMEPDSGTTNIRNTESKHWKRWLGVEHRCVVPFTSFSEFNKAAGGDVWFALDESRPLAFFAGIWCNWTSVRKVKEGETTNDLYGFLTTEPNAEVAPRPSQGDAGHSANVR